MKNSRDHESKPIQFPIESGTNGQHRPLNRRSDLTKREILIQRLVNNEMSFDERIQMLASIDRWQDGWRELALAFVEEQAFASAMCEQSPDREQIQSHRPVAIHEKGSRPDACSTANGGECIELESRATGRHRRFSGFYFAATVLISLSIGMLVSQSAIVVYSRVTADQGNMDIHPDNASGTDHVVQATDSLRLPQQQADLDMGFPGRTPEERDVARSRVPVAHSTLKFPNAETGETTDVPLIDLESLFGFAEPNISREFVETLHDGGYRLEPHTHFVRGQLSDQREVVVPVRQWSLKSFIQ